MRNHGSIRVLNTNADREPLLGVDYVFGGVEFVFIKVCWQDADSDALEVLGTQMFND